MKTALFNTILSFIAVLAQAGSPQPDSLAGTWEVPPATPNLFKEPFLRLFTFTSNGVLRISEEDMSGQRNNSEGMYSYVMYSTTNVLTLTLNDHQPRLFTAHLEGSTLQLSEFNSSNRINLQKVPLEEVARCPTKPGVYESQRWTYVYREGYAGKAAASVGHLYERGQLVTAEPGTITNTPVGRFIYFPYDQGWLNTRFGRPVFKEDGSLPADLQRFFDTIQNQHRTQNQTSEAIGAEAAPQPQR